MKPTQSLEIDLLNPIILAAILNEGRPIAIGLQCLHIAHHHQVQAGPSQRHVHSPIVVQEANVPLAIGTDHGHDDDILLAALVPVHGVHFDVLQLELRVQYGSKQANLSGVGRDDACKGR